jgi:hypothetical protein
MNTPTRKSVNVALELGSGRHYGVFIDDTGSPGLNSPGLHAQRKSALRRFEYSHFWRTRP